jgi:hypothetical protein
MDRLPRHTGEENFYDLPIYRENDVSKLRRGGTPRSPEGKIRHANRLNEQKDMMNKLAAEPPMTGDMLKHSQDYKEYMNASMSGQPMQKNSYYSGVGFGGMGLGGSAMGGIPSRDDPTNSPTRWNIPTWNEKMPLEEKEELQAIARDWCDYYYYNHPVVPICLDIYSKYPFVGLDIQAPDPQVEDEYRQMFFDELDYTTFLPFASLQYWKYGEAPILGEWNSTYGGWTDDSMVMPDQISVRPWYRPGRNKETYLWYPPQEMIDIVNDSDGTDPRLPEMIDEFGEQLYDWAEGYPSELSPEVFSLLRNNKEINGTRGYPILMKAFGTLMKEEKLNLATNAIADRLHTPLLVVKLGHERLLQGKYPWMPTPEQTKQMQTHLEMMMASRYRMMVYHMGIEFENPFAGQTIPDLDKDFDRSTKELMGVFGIPQELIYGGSQGTYASGALSAEIMMQNLATTQQIWSRWVIESRAKKVAEARGFYEVERKGNIYTKPLERVIEYDSKGNKVVRERRKLMLPSMRFKTMDFNTDVEKAKAFADLRRTLNIPITDKTITSLYDRDLDLGQEAQGFAQEQVDKYEMNKQLGPAAPQVGGPGAIPGGPAGIPGGGRPRPGGMPGMDGADRGEGIQPGSRPPISDERRDNMPTPEPSGQEPVLTHYKFADRSNSQNLTAEDKKKFAAKFASMDKESVEEYQRRGEQDTTMRKKSSYADEHAFFFARRTHKKSGVTYYMQGRSLRMAPSK